MMAIRPIDSESTVECVWRFDPAFEHDASVEVASLPDALAAKLQKRRQQVLEVYKSRDLVPSDDLLGPEMRRVAAYEILAPGDPGCWREVLTKLPGMEPTIFVIGVIPPSELAAFEDASRDGGQSSLQWKCFRAAVRGIKNGPTLKKQQDGRLQDVVPMTARGDRVDPVWLEGIFGRGLLKCALELGAIAWGWNHLTEDEAKN